MSASFDTWLESYQQSIARPLIEANEGHRVSRILGRLDVVALKAAYEAGVKKGEQHGAPVPVPREDQSDDSSRS